MLTEQVQEILATLSLAFDNLLESSSSSSSLSTSTPPLSITPVNRVSSPLEASPSRPHRPGRVKKFQRPSRRLLQSKTPSPCTSPVSLEEVSSSRKRSWDAEAIDSFQDTADAPDFHGKRSKSIVLLQELESLRVSSPPSPIDSELAILAEQEFSLNCCANENSILSLSKVRIFNEVLGELEALSGIEDVFEALRTANPAVLSQNRSQLTAWCKWRLLSKTFESFDDPRLPMKGCLNRFIGLCRALNHIADELDWRDPELSFLIFRGISQLLARQTLIDLKSSNLMRKLDEFVGLIRALTLACTILWNRPPRFVLQFLASHAQHQLNEFFEQLLEAGLNLFELCSVLTSNLGMSRTFALIFVHFARLFVLAASASASSDDDKVVALFHEKLRKCKLNE
jgi:hypothetical protein